MPGKVQESLWEKAKKRIAEEYKNLTKENPRYWKLVSSVYKKMGGSFTSKTEKSLGSIISHCEYLEENTPAGVLDKSLWLEIKDDVETTIKSNTPTGMILQLLNYINEGGRFVQKSLDENVSVNELLPTIEITKSNIVSSFNQNSAEPIINMLKAAIPGMEKYPHKYIKREKTKAGKWRYFFHPETKKDKEAAMKRVEQGATKEHSEAEEKKRQAPSKVKTEGDDKKGEIVKVIEKLKTMKEKERKVYLSKMPEQLREAVIQKISGKGVEKSQRTEDEALAERIEKGDLRPGGELIESNVKEELNKGGATYHAKEEAEASEHYKKMAKEEKSPEDKKKLEQMAAEEKQHSEFFKKKKSEGKKFIENGVVLKSQEAVKDPNMNAWIESRKSGIVVQIMNNYPTLKKSDAESTAQKMLENMYSKGLR